MFYLLIKFTFANFVSLERTRGINDIKMEIYKLRLLSKNNVKNGIWLYQPWVIIYGVTFFCTSIASKKPTINIWAH